MGSSLRSQIFATTAFGYRKITVERPLRLNFEVSDERLARLEQQAAFAGLAASGKPTGKGSTKGKSKQRDEAEVAAEVEAGRAQQEAIRAALRTLPATHYTDRAAFERDLDAAMRAASLRPGAPVVKAIVAALGERDETAQICRDRQGNPEPDPELRDTENVPLGEDVFAYFEREVRPHVPDAWVNTEKRDAKDGEVGIVGYEINFNRYFYQYTPPRPLDEIEADLRALEGEILSMLREVAR